MKRVVGRWIFRITWMGVAWLSIGSVARAQSLETITLHHRRAEDLIPVLQPLIPDGAALSGTGDVLLVRADAATLEQLRTAIATLDRAPRELLITVGQTSALDRGATSVRGSGTISSGNVQVGVNQPPQATTGAQVAVRHGTAEDQVHNVSSVRALEGYEAYVSTGETRPFTSGSVVGAGGHRGTVVAESTEYRDVHSGFYVLPRVSGDRVTLEISPTQQHLAPGQRNTVATQSVTTTVSGRLGEWIPLGSATGGRDGQSTGIVTYSTRSDDTAYSAWVKVDEVK
jgi:type II secretory pathway component GspD/PulD (secretin)